MEAETTVTTLPAELQKAASNLTTEQKELLTLTVQNQLIRVQSLGRKSLEKEKESLMKALKENRLQQTLERNDLGNGVAMVGTRLLKTNSTARTFMLRFIAGTKQIELTPEQVLMFFEEDACAKARQVASLYLKYEEEQAKK